MSVTNPISPAPIPLRPLNRTRRRSSSLSAIYSSPEVDQGNGQFSSHNRADRKSTKRSRVNHNPSSPLKQSQHAFPTVAFPLQETEWNCSSPFSNNRLASSSTSFAFQNPVPSTTPSSAFTSSPFDFSLPSTSARPTTTTFERLPRTRTTSFPSNSIHPFSNSSAYSGSPPNLISNPLSTAPYETNFTDSSFSSFNSSSGPPSPPSAATSPPSPPNFTFLSSRTPSLDTSATSNEGEEETMKCDKSLDEIEAERLHHVAFEQLRKTTKEDEEGFVDRMRRWECDHALESDVMVGMMDQPSNEAEEDETEEDVQADDEEDELEFQVEVNVEPPSSFEVDRRNWQRTNRVTELDFDDLARRMKSGACELEDYGLVREIQAKATG